MSVVLEFVNSSIMPVLMASGAEALTDQIRGFVAPFVLLVISCVALTFLMKREMMQFVTFLLIAIAVAAVFYAPGLLANLGKDAGESNQNISWQ